VDGVNFNVFLDGDLTDGIACPEYFGKPATLSATFQGPGQGVAGLTENGSTTQYNMSSLFVDDCPNVQPTPVYPPEISHAAVYTLKGFGSQWLGLGAEITDESGEVETGVTAWVIGPASLYVPLRFDPGVRFYNDDDAGLSILKGDYTFYAEKNGVEAVPVTKTLSTVYVIEPPVFKPYDSPPGGTTVDPPMGGRYRCRGLFRVLQVQGRENLSVEECGKYVRVVAERHFRHHTGRVLHRGLGIRNYGGGFGREIR